MASVKRKRWLIGAGIFLLATFLIANIFELQIRYAVFHYRDLNTVNVAGTPIKMGSMWVPLPVQFKNSLTLIKISRFGAKRHGMISFHPASAEEMASIADAPTASLPWNGARVARIESQFVVALPSHRLFIITDNEANLRDIVNVGSINDG